MTKKAVPGTGRLSKGSHPYSRPLNEARSWEKDLYFYAQATHRKAKNLAGALQLASNSIGESMPIRFSTYSGSK